MSSQVQILSLLSDGRWWTTTAIAQAIPYTCRDFSTHRNDVYWKLRIMLRRGEVYKLRDGCDCIWKVKG